MDKELLDSIVKTGYAHATDLSIYDEDFLEKMLLRRQDVLGIKSVAAYCDYLNKNNAETELFLHSIHITFSQFFRETLSFAILEQFILPNIIRNSSESSEIRIWSAGCAAGQEAYSLAMLLDEQFALKKKDLRYRIFATDVSKDALVDAENGSYNESTLKNVRWNQVKTYFLNTGEKYSIIPRLKQHISFSYYDLLDTSSDNPPESIFGGFDIILCCNVLMYYKPDMRYEILNKLQKSMSSTGFLIVGEAERAFVESTTNLRALAALASVFRR